MNQTYEEILEILIIVFSISKKKKIRCKRTNTNINIKYRFIDALLDSYWRKKRQKVVKLRFDVKSQKFGKHITRVL